MEQNEIVEQMRKAMEQAQITNVPKLDVIVQKNENTDIGENEWVKTLPMAGKDEFIMYLEYQNERFVVCAEDLAWTVIQDIDVECYKKSLSYDEPYYAGEHKRREILSLALKWIADVNSECIEQNDGNLLSKIKHEYIDVIWLKYESLITLSPREVSTLESLALSYFKRDIEKKPIPSIVIEIDMLIHFGNLTWEEIRNIKYSKLQQIKIILKARAEALQLDTLAKDNESAAPKTKKVDNSLSKLPAGLFPPGVREQMMMQK